MADTCAPVLRMYVTVMPGIPLLAMAEIHIEHILQTEANQTPQNVTAQSNTPEYIPDYKST